MTSLRSIVIAEPVRTAIGTFDGSLKDVTAPNLGAVAIGPPSNTPDSIRRRLAPRSWARSFRPAQR